MQDANYLQTKRQNKYRMLKDKGIGKRLEFRPAHYSHSQFFGFFFWFLCVFSFHFIFPDSLDL